MALGTLTKDEIDNILNQAQQAQPTPNSVPGATLSATKAEIDAILSPQSKPSKQSSGRKKNRDLTDKDAAKKLGQSLLNAAEAGDITADPGYSVAGMADAYAQRIPALGDEPASNVIPFKNYSRDGYSPNEMRSMIDALTGVQNASERRERARMENMSPIDRNREIMAQMNAQDDIPETTRYAGLNRRIAEAQKAKEGTNTVGMEEGLAAPLNMRAQTLTKNSTVNGDRLELLQKLQDEARARANEIPTLTGDAGVDEAIAAQQKNENLREVGRLQTQIDRINQYNDMLENNADFASDIEKLWNATQGASVGGINPNAVTQGVLGGTSLDDFYSQLEKKYDLTRDELDDLAMSYNANNQSEISEGMSREAQEFGADHPVLGSAVSLPMTLANTAEGAYNTLIGGITGDDRRLSNMMRDTKAGFREGAKENIDSNIGKTIYDLGMGLADMGVGAAVGSAPAVLAGNTANEAVLSANERGVDTREAALYGGLAGAADYYFNKVGLDKAKQTAFETLKGVGLKDVIKRAAAAGGFEAGENVLQDITQSIMDEFINNRQSEMRTSYAQKIADGMNENEAFKAVLKEKAAQIAMSGATGFGMGALMNLGTTAKQSLQGQALQELLNENSDDFNERFEAWKREQAESAQNLEAPSDEELNPLEMARQAEEGVDALANERQAVADEMQRLSEQIPQTPTDPVGMDEPTPSNIIPTDNVTPTTQAPKSDTFVGNGDTSDSQFITNTARKAGIVEDGEWETDPELADITTRDVHHNADVQAKAQADIAENRDKYLSEYISNERNIDTDLEFDRAMTLLQSGDLSSAERNILLDRIATSDRAMGEYLQAHVKYGDTSESALVKATKVNQDQVSGWKSNNVKRVEQNNRIANAINQIGKPEKPPVKKIPLTHDQLKEQIQNTLLEAFGDDAAKFTADDLEYLTILAEEKKIPVRKITAELEHKLETGEWFTLDESLPKKVEKAVKNGQISKMLDRIVNGEPPKVKEDPIAYGEFLKRIRNSLQDENLGLAEEFNDLDTYFIGRMIQEKVPKKIIEDELKHRVETGEWYTIKEWPGKKPGETSYIEPPKPKNQKLENAFKILRGEGEKATPEPKTFEQIREEIVGSLEKNEALDDFDDADIDYLTNLVQQNASTNNIADALNTKTATGRWGIADETQQRVNEIFEYIRHYDPDSEEFISGQAEAYRLLAEEILPSASAIEKFDAWRYMAMLGNPKTMFRNWVGNKLFSAVTGASNNLAAAMEHGVDWVYNKRTGDHIQRTKEFLNPVKDRELLKATAQDANNKRYSRVDSTKYERLDEKSLRRSRSVWDSDAMRLSETALNKGTSDKKAVIKKYSTSLAGYMKANGLTQADIDASYKFDQLNRESRTRLLTPEEAADMEALRDVAARMEKARDYAIDQAEYATFHEDNEVAKKLTQHVNDWRNSQNPVAKGLGYAIEGLVPFKKTPANILRSGFEYSPFGALKSIAKTGKLIYENTGSRKGNLADEYAKTKRNGEIKKDRNKNPIMVKKTLAHDVIDSWAKTLTGTGLTYLGYYLFNKGILTSSYDDEKYQDQLEGKGNYAININGHTFTLDWAAPGVMPLLIGAEINKVMKSNGELDEAWYSNPDRWMETFNALMDPMMETSMMSGVKDTLQTAANEYRYNENGSAIGGILGAIAGNTLTGYATQAIPTLSGQIARTIDPIRRTTDTTNEGVLGVIEKQARKVANKIPFLSKLNPEYRDAYGRGQFNSPFEYEEGEPGLNALKALGNAGYQFLLPSYYSKVNETDADRKAREIYNSKVKDEEGKLNPLKDSKVFATWKSTKKIDGKKLDPEQMQTYRERSGQANYDMRNTLANSEWFNSLNPAQQNEIFKSMNSLADKVGSYAVAPESVDFNGKLKEYIEGGAPEVLKNLEAEYNKYGLSKDTYNDLMESGEDMTPYEGFGDALAKYEDVNENAGLREAYATGGEQGLDNEVNYQKALKANGLSNSEANRAAYDANPENGLQQIAANKEAAVNAGFVKSDGTPNVEAYNKVVSVVGDDPKVVSSYTSFRDSMEGLGTKREVYIPKLEAMPGLTVEQKGQFAYLYGGAPKSGSGADKAKTKYGYEGYYDYLMIQNAPDLNRNGKAHDKGDRIKYMYDVLGWDDSDDIYTFFNGLNY